MKKSIGALLVLSSLSLYADQIVSGTNMNGRSVRSYVENGEVVVAKCKNFSVYDIKEKCEEVSQKRFPSREDFMQQSIYNLVTYGSKNKKVQGLVDKIKKLKSNTENEKVLVEKEKELKELNDKMTNMNLFAKQSGQSVQYSTAYKQIVSGIAEVQSQIETLSGQSNINKGARKALDDLALIVAETYENIAHNEDLVIEKKDSVNDELIELLLKKDKKDLTKVSMFKKASDFTIDEILTQKCKKSVDPVWDRTKYEIDGRMKYNNSKYAFFESFDITIFDSSTEKDVDFSFYSHTGNETVYSGAFTKQKNFDKLTTSRNNFINELLKNSSVCHDATKLSMVTGKMSLEDLAKVEVVREEVKVLPSLNTIGIQSVGDLSPSTELMSISVSNDDRSSVKDTKAFSKKKSRRSRASRR